MTRAETSPSPRLSSPLDALREEMRQCRLDGVVVPRFDAHQGEYCAPHDNRLAFISGFTGSAGIAVVTQEEAVIFVDGRYQVQVRQEVDPACFAVAHFDDEPLEKWLAANVRAGQRFGFNAMLIPSEWDEKFAAAVKGAGGEWVAVARDPVDAVWPDQPAPPLGKVNAFALEYAGEDSASKRRRIGEELARRGVDFLIEAQPDNIAWLLNVRGSDVAFNPMPHSFLVLDRHGGVEWLIDSRKLPNDRSAFELDGVEFGDPARLIERIEALAADARVLVDPSFAPSAARHAVEGAGGEAVCERSPVTMAKMMKNPVELAGFRKCHMEDGAAWVAFLAWLQREGRRREAEGRPITELEAEEQILLCRQRREGFVEPSFRTISAAGKNAAMCHYSASAGSEAAISSQGVYLVDSGGQYYSGTTDATRTTALGPIGENVRMAFTAVLKGFIAMMTLRFPKGTRGHQVDAIARRPLWDFGLDYDHGTGHGVGHFLSVHEQPQRFEKQVNDIDLKPGMVTTIEPGHYVMGEYGIRIENQVEVVEFTDGFLGFKSLTLVPIDVSLADLSALSDAEIDWINRYHAKVAQIVGPLVDAATGDWLDAVTRPVSRRQRIPEIV